MAKKSLTILADTENPVPLEIFEQAIVDLAKGFKKLQSSRLTKRAIVLLVQDYVGPGRISRIQVEAVLDAAAELDKYYLKKA